MRKSFNNNAVQGVAVFLASAGAVALAATGYAGFALPVAAAAGYLYNTFEARFDAQEKPSVDQQSGATLSGPK